MYSRLLKNVRAISAARTAFAQTVCPVTRPNFAVANTVDGDLATGKRNGYTAAALSAAGQESGARQGVLVQ
jgi:hypothetical protein